MNFISRLIRKTTEPALKSDLTSLSLSEQARYIIKKGKFIEKRTAGDQTLALYLLDQTYFELLSGSTDQVISKVMEINHESMERFYGKKIVLKEA
jgi:hypothetical protein